MVCLSNIKLGLDVFESVMICLLRGLASNSFERGKVGEGLQIITLSIHVPKPISFVTQNSCKFMFRFICFETPGCLLVIHII